MTDDQAKRGAPDHPDGRIDPCSLGAEDRDDPLSSPANTEDQADFIVDLDSIFSWDAPHDEIEIEVEELQKIVQAIEEEFEKLGLVVEFD